MTNNEESSSSRGAFKNLFIVILTAFVTAAASSYFAKEKDLEVRSQQDKAQRYEELIVLLDEGFVNRYVSREKRIAAKKKYNEETYVVWLYASDEVIVKLNRFCHAFSALAWEEDSERRKARLALTRQVRRELMLAMRQDVLGRTDLTEKDFLPVDVKQESELDRSSADSPAEE